MICRRCHNTGHVTETTRRLYGPITTLHTWCDCSEGDALKARQIEQAWNDEAERKAAYDRTEDTLWGATHSDAQLAALHGAPWAAPLTVREIERAQKGADK